MEERHRREDRKSIPSGEINVSERQWGREFFQWPSAHLHFLLLGYFPGRGTLDTVLVDEMWAKDLGWVSILLEQNKKQKLTQFFNIASFHLTIFIAWNMEEKLEIWQPHCEYKVQSQHTKVGAAERQKGLGLLSQCWGVTIALNCLPASWLFLYKYKQLRLSNHLLCYMNHS